MKQTDAYGCEDVIPGGFVGLMDLYEGNYIKLRKLLPEVSSLVDQHLSQVEGHLDLHLRIEERSKFTTTLYLSYAFSSPEGIQMEPNLKIRIYHDAQLAEVMAGHLHHGRLILDNLPADALKEKWRLNRFLHKWLGYSLKQGHSFVVRPDAA